MNPSDAGTSDTDVVQEVIKEIAQYHPLDSNSFKVVFLSEADSLSRNAQHALRRTMEKYMSSCRIIMCCESLNKIISPLRSRCLAIRVPAPTEEEVCKVLTKVGEKENFRVNAQLATKVTRHSERNLRRALLLLETCKVQVSRSDICRRTDRSGSGRVCRTALQIQASCPFLIGKGSPRSLPRTFVRSSRRRCFCRQGAISMSCWPTVFHRT